MENNIEKYSCVDCIWQDQCQSDEPCEFFFRGQLESELPTDEEIEVRIETERQKFHREFQKYVGEFN